MTEQQLVTPRTKDSLKVQALSQSFAQKVVQYENELADFRADATLEIERLQGQIAELQNQVQVYVNQINQAEDEREPDGVLAEEADSSEAAS